MKTVSNYAIAIVTIIFLLETSVGHTVLAFMGYMILAAMGLLFFIVLRLYVARIQGRRWEREQIL